MAPMPQLTVNDVGDMVLTEAVTMDALADPVRLAIMDRLTRGGSVTTADLADHAGLGVDDARAHIEALAVVGLVEPDGGCWRAPGSGIYFEIPESGGAEAQAAARRLCSAMLLNYERAPRLWVEDVEPRLDLTWARAAGLFNAGVSVTADELRTIQVDLEKLLEPYLGRTNPPEGSRRVRMLAYFLPSAAG